MISWLAKERKGSSWARKFQRFSPDRRAPSRIGCQFELLEPRILFSLNPSPAEQAMMEDINRFRTNPRGELDVLFRNLEPLLSDNSDIQGAINFFDVSSTVLQQQWNQLEPVAPLAWNESLTDAAFAHNQVMIEHDQQAHVLPGEPDIGQRAKDAGYEFRNVGENVFAFGRSTIHAHAGFIVDWGDTPSGIQDPPGHRNNMLSSNFTEVGISIVPERNSQTDVGPLLITQDFGGRRGYIPQMLGVVYDDRNTNGRYDAGEGLGGAQIIVQGEGLTFRTFSMGAGGYQLEVPDGIYNVTVVGGGLASPLAAVNVVMDGENEKMDFTPQRSLRAPTAIDDSTTTTEDVAVKVNVVANDFDVDGSIDARTIQITQQPVHGTVRTVGTAGLVDYQPDSDYSGVDSFRYLIRDNDGAVSNEALVRVVIGEVNDAPIARDDRLSTREDTTLRLAIAENDIDLDGSIDQQFLRIVQQPSHGRIVTTLAGEMQYQPDADYFGDDSFRYTISDDQGLVSNIATVTVDVVAVNDSPVGVADEIVVPQGVHATFFVSANDHDIDGTVQAASVRIVGQPRHGEVRVSNNGRVTYLGDRAFFGVDSFQYTIRDNEGALSASTSVRLTVTEEGFPWRNPVDHADVTNDGVVAPRDALRVIENIGRQLNDGSSTADSPPPFVDLTGDGFVSPRDAILVINELARRQSGQVPVAPLSDTAFLGHEQASASTAEHVENNSGEAKLDSANGRHVSLGNDPSRWTAAPEAHSIFQVNRNSMVSPALPSANAADHVWEMEGAPRHLGPSPIHGAANTLIVKRCRSTDAVALEWLFQDDDASVLAVR